MTHPSVPSATTRPMWSSCAAWLKLPRQDRGGMSGWTATTGGPSTPAWPAPAPTERDWQAWRIEMGDTMADLQAAGYREATVERTLLRADRYDLWATIRPGDVGGTGRNQHTKAA